MPKVKKKEFVFNLFLSFILIGLIWVLNCNIYLKIIAGICAIAVLILSVKYKWDRSRCFLCFLAIAMVINFYFDYKIYSPYRNEQSGNYNSRCGFTTSQVAYTYNSGNSDVLLYLIMRDKSVYLYGNVLQYYNLIQRFSRECVGDSVGIEVDFLADRQELFFNAGRINPYKAYDCFEANDIPILQEVRYTNKPCLYISLEEIVETNELVVAIDSLHNFYVMTIEQWEKIKNEK